jgi:hypothetical protein
MSNISSPLTPESATNFLVSIPNQLVNMSADDQAQAIQTLLQSSLFGQLLGAQDQASMQQVLTSILTSLFDSGSLFKLFNQDQPQSVDSQNILTQSLSQQIADTINNAASRSSGQPADTTNENLTLEIPPQAADAPPETANSVATLLGNGVAQALTEFFGKTTQGPASTGQAAVPTDKAAAGTGDASTTAANTTTNTATAGVALMTTTAGQASTTPTTEEALMSMMATTTTGAALMTMMPTTTTGEALMPETSTQTLPPQTLQSQTLQPQIQDLLANLFATGIATADNLPTAIIIPQAVNPEIFKENFPQLKQQLLDQFAEISQQINSLVAQTQEDLPRGSTAQNFIVACQQITTLATQLQQNDQGFMFNMLNTMAANSKIMENSILHQVFDSFQDKADFLKNFLSASITTGAGAAAVALAQSSPEMKMQMLNQMLAEFPNLLNIPVVKQLLGEIAGGVKSQSAAKLLQYQKLLLNAAKEIKTVARGSLTDEYTSVSLLHPALEALADIIELTNLPIRPEDLSLEQMESLTHDITFNLETIKLDNSAFFYDMLSKHPRTVLFLAYIDSNLLDGYRLPMVTKSILEADRRELEQHLERILNVIHKFEKSVEFLKFQPRVLELLIHEAKYDPTLDITRHSLKIVNKAIADYSSFIDLDSP